MKGWISLHRKFLNWEWYNDSNTKSLFIHCLLKANHEDNEWRNVNVARGQFFTSIKHLSNDLSLSEKQIRICLGKLKRTSEVATKGASNGTMITVCKYNEYQYNEKQKGEQKGEEKGRERATNNKEDKVIKDISIQKIKKSVDKKKNPFTKTTTEFYKKQIEDNSGKKNTDKYRNFANYINGVNDSGIVAKNLLKMEEQLTYEQFEKLINKNVTVLDYVDSYINKGYNDNKSIYLTFLGWHRKNSK